MNKVARILFSMVGIIFPIVIGTLHTITHFGELVRPEIKNFLQQEFIILGKSQSLWNTWGIVSFMMGISFIIIGSIFILRAIGDFNQFGFFKKRDGSKFALKDSQIFIPICLFLGISAFLITFF